MKTAVTQEPTEPEPANEPFHAGVQPASTMTRTIAWGGTYILSEGHHVTFVNGWKAEEHRHRYSSSR